MNTVYSYALFAFGFGVVLIGYAAFLRRNDDVGKSFLVFSAAVFGWAVLMAVWIPQKFSYEETLYLSRVSNSIAAFIPLTWMRFVFAMCEKDITPYRSLFVGVALLGLVLCGAGLFTDSFVSGLHSILDFNYYTSADTLLFHVFAAHFFIIVTFSYVFLINAYKNARGPRRVSLYYVLIATSMGFLAGGSTFLQAYRIPFPFEMVLVMPLYPFFLGVALLKYGLFDERSMAQAAHRDKLAAIGTIATSINHELRNPLYVIHGIADTFIHKAEKATQNNCSELERESISVLQRIVQHAQRAMDIMAQLSVFAKQKGGIEIQKESVSIRECLERVLPLVNHEMTLDNITLKNRLPENLPPITANARQIEEVLFNLIVNACQALKKTGGEIEISGRGQEKSVEVTIQDNGPGISRDQLKNIFEPFYTTKDEGTGLGLYIVRQLVERNDGRIRAESADGGALFVMVFEC